MVNSSYQGVTLRQQIPQLLNGFSQDGMHELGGNFGERYKYEPALAHRRVRHRQLGSPNYLGAEKKDVDVNEARTFWLSAFSAHRLFNCQNAFQEVARLKPRAGGHGAVEKPGLVGEIDGLGLVSGGNLEHVPEFQ